MKMIIFRSALVLSVYMLTAIVFFGNHDKMKIVFPLLLAVIYAYFIDFNKNFWINFMELNALFIVLMVVSVALLNPLEIMLVVEYVALVILSFFIVYHLKRRHRQNKV